MFALCAQSGECYVRIEHYSSEEKKGFASRYTTLCILSSSSQSPRAVIYDLIHSWVKGMQDFSNAALLFGEEPK